MNKLASKKLYILASLALLWLQACDFGSESSSDDSSQKQAVVVAFTSDYTTGELRWMSADSQSLESGSLSFFQDSKLAVSGDRLFVLERLGADNLNCVDLKQLGQAGAVQQLALEEGANPSDAVVLGKKGWLALSSVAYIQSFDPVACSVGERVDLSDFSQKGELSPHASVVLADGNTLLVLLQRLQSKEITTWGTPFIGQYPNLPGLLVRLDGTTGAFIDSIPLHFHNPASAILDQGKLYVASSGDNLVNMGQFGGVEVVDLAGKTSTVVADSAALGGGANYIALDRAHQVLYTSVNIGFGNTPVKPINLTQKTVGAPLSGIADSFGELAFDEETGRLYVGDRTYGQEKFWAFDGQKTTAISVGDALPVYDVITTRW